MPILPIDLQIIMMRMDELTKQQYSQQDGVSLAQLVKGSELSELSNIQSSRVNEVKPHPDGNTKVEDKQQKEKYRREKEKTEKNEKIIEKKRKEIIKEFQDPDKGIHIDIKR